MPEQENISIKRLNPHPENFYSGEINKIESKPFSNLFYPYVVDNAGSKNIVSLTLDIMNKKDYIHKTFPNENWHNENRNVGSLLKSEPIWGFKETYNPNKISQSVSNAFCFHGQKLTFYIAHQGYLIGSIGNKFLYCRNTLTIKYLDTITGQNGIICEFNNFNGPLDDDSRYVEWQVPMLNDEDDFDSYKMFGSIVVRAEIQNEFFHDAEFNNPYEEYNNKNSSILNLLVYSPAKELYDVTEKEIDILKDPVIEFDEIQNLFDKTILDDLKNSNQNELNDDQKRAIVADQVAVLFMSQHPVLTADHYPSKILGYGAEESFLSKINQQVRNYYGDKTYNLVRDRLFGIIASYKRFNYISDLERTFTDKYQSNQKVKDPSRILMVGEDEKLDYDFGVNGVLFNPYVVETNNVETMLNVDIPENMEFSFNLSNNSVDISNIKITNGIGEKFINGDMDVIVEFDVLSGAENIKRIKWSVFTKNNLNHVEVTENINDNITNKMVMIPLLNPVSYDQHSNTQSGLDIVYVKIDIEDYNGYVNSFYHEEKVYSKTVGVKSIKAKQRDDGSGLVDLYYEKFGNDELDNGKIEISFFVNGFEDPWRVNPVGLHGDYGLNVMSGIRKVVCDPKIVYPGWNLYSLAFRTRVKNSDGENGIWDDSNTVLLNFTKPEVAVRKFRPLTFDETNIGICNTKICVDFVIM